ncbi:MAG: hypothetical protein KDJ77_13210 [Rhodobiaceae bacterium]|nr:hypothetical protein [Rhodobiaceae bacterium]
MSNEINKETETQPIQAEELNDEQLDQAQGGVSLSKVADIAKKTNCSEDAVPTETWQLVY